jgi:hypothetical protein
MGEWRYSSTILPFHQSVQKSFPDYSYLQKKNQMFVVNACTDPTDIPASAHQ